MPTRCLNDQAMFIALHKSGTGTNQPRNIECCESAGKGKAAVHRSDLFFLFAEPCDIRQNSNGPGKPHLTSNALRLAFRLSSRM